MPPTVALFVSAGLYCAFIAFAALLLSRGPAGRRSFAGALGVLSYLPAFTFLPVGRLPALMPGAYAGVAAWGLLFGGALLSSPDGAEAKKTSLRLLPALAACGILAAFAAGRGIPGSPLRPDTFTAMPLWELTDATGKAGLTLLFCSFTSAFTTASPFATEGILHRLLVAALAVALVFPGVPESLADLPPAADLFAGFLFFAGKVAAIAAVGQRAAKARGALPFSCVCAAAGGALLALASPIP